MKKAAIFLFYVLFLKQVSILAQNTEQDELINRPFQLTFVTPLGTNGLEAGKITNNFSINMFAGYNGGLSGIEMGGFANTIRYNMNGVQMAGFSNVVLGKSKGCQISGFSNISMKIPKGSQIAGFSNIVNDSAVVVQISGFSNLVNGKTKGAQIAGFSNFSAKDAEVSQIAGFSNLITGDLIGSQLAGFANITAGNAKAFQVAGFTNIATKDVNGVQISGFLNYAKKLKGFQIGVFNYCDTVEKGLPIGVLSIVKNGYHQLEISGDEMFYTNIAFRSGLEKFHSIITAGIQPDFISAPLWTYGVGIGSLFPINEKTSADVDVMFQHVIKGDDVDNNYLYKIGAGLDFKLTKKLSVYAGVTYNFLVTDVQQLKYTENYASLAPYYFTKKENSHYNLKSWAGFKIGLRFF
jgi:hypothetical protein